MGQHALVLLVSGLFALAASDCSEYIPRFPYTPCRNRSDSAQCVVACDGSGNTIPTFNLTCVGQSWRLDGKHPHFDCHESFNQTGSDETVVITNPAITRLPAGLPRDLRQLTIIHSCRVDFRALADYHALGAIQIYNGNFVNHVGHLSPLVHLQRLTLITSNRSQLELLQPIPMLPGLAWVNVSATALNISHLRLQYPQLEVVANCAPFTSNANNPQALDRHVASDDSHTSPWVQSDVITLGMLHVENTTAVRMLRLAVTSWDVLVPLRRNSGAAALELVVWSPEPLIELKADTWLPDNGQMMRLELWMVGTVYLELNVAYAALRPVRNYNSPVDGNPLGFSLTSTSGMRCRPSFYNGTEFADASRKWHLCDCADPPFRNATHCPRTIPFACIKDGQRIRLNNTQLCDGLADCSDGVDEEQCHLTVIDQSVNPLLGPAQAIFCYITINMSMSQGVFDQPGVDPATGAFVPEGDHQGFCYAKHGVVRSSRSIEGAMMDNTFRIFVDADNCGYIQFRFKGEHRAGFLQIFRVQVAGFLSSRPIEDCHNLDHEEFARLYDEYHATELRRLSSTTTMAPPVKVAQSQSSSGVIAAIAVSTVVVVSLLLFMIYRRNMRQQDTERADSELRQLLRKANTDLDDVLTSTTLHASSELPVLPRHDITLLRKLGDGHFGQVWHAHVSESKKAANDVALKYIRTSGVADPQAASAIAQGALMEALLHHRLRHNHIAACHGVVQLQDGMGIVLELASHGDMLTYVRSHTAKIAQQMLWAQQLASALAYLHESEVLHRDLALRNVLLKHERHALLADFGLSRFVSQNTSYYTSRSEVEVPFRWLAPEALLKQSFSQASDVWSFGVLLWEVLHHGQQPFEGQASQQLEVLHRHHKGVLAFDSSLASHRLTRVAQACMQYDRALRPPAKQVLERISGVAGGEAWCELASSRV
eukprot:TRINITY_DN10552_c0_g1_i2.p1 TRINITY_DN10552_c0_g1~~TRINITY_DN10552_c0_g1_i2.p1  ORF type:complete len:938 (+),score=136.95 TRINITY_DN10552_c0_g1_i2:34-2847(+)